MILDRRGFTLIEILVAGVIGSVITSGIFAAYVAAARMMGGANSAEYVEAANFGQQTLERLRNEVAADSTWFTNQAGTGWQADPDLLVGGGSRSIVNPPGATRMMCVLAEDCDGVGGAGDCYAVRVRVCWNGTACPSPGSPCG